MAGRIMRSSLFYPSLFYLCGCFAVLSRSTASQSCVATSSRRFSKAARGAVMSGLSSFARVCIRLIIAREIVGVAIISFVSTGAICKAVWQMVG